MTKFACQNCTWKGEYEDATPARDVDLRHEMGDTFSDIECPDCGALCYEAEEENAAGFWSVSVFLCELCYGGPEEGGWWYTGGQVSSEADKAVLHRRFLKREEAHAYADDLNTTLGSVWNEGRREMSSVLSDGRYMALVNPGAPDFFPAVRPHYG
jgi:hypothetical protein